MYNLIFQDNKIFTGGDINNSLWSTIPDDKEIKQLTYIFPNLDKLILTNYEAYNHLIEKITILNKGNLVSKIIIMAKKKNNVVAFTYNFLTNKLNILNYKFGEEYNGKPAGGWKNGVIDGLNETKLERKSI